MNCLVSNQARNPWLCLKSPATPHPPAESQPRALSSLHLCPGSSEFEYVFSEVTCIGTLHVATGTFKDSKKHT